ncbi:MAG TPA: STAS domain-containing protein [Solirubrobacteraceae bacterium]|nr:STAS domain-containing protein [Solirubrobacteraceae bacterium]
MTSQTFAIQRERLSAGLRMVVVRGELDLFAAPELKQAISEALVDDIRDLIVDLTRTVFIDSSGLAVLMLAMKRAHSLGGRLIVIDAGGSVARTFQIAGVDQILTIVPTREAALAALADGESG